MPEAALADETLGEANSARSFLTLRGSRCWHGCCQSDRECRLVSSSPTGPEPGVVMDKRGRAILEAIFSG